MTLRQALSIYEARLVDDPKAALGGLVAVARAAPEYWPVRFRLVDALLTLGEVDATIHLLENLARSFASHGMPMQAILACKLIESCGRDSDRVASEIGMLYAGLFGQELVPNPTPVELPVGPMPTPVPPDEAVEAAMLLGDMPGDLPARYPAIPLLSRLTPEDFIVVLRALKLHRVAHGARIVSKALLALRASWWPKEHSSLPDK